MPVKPERIHGKQVLAYIDGIPTRRIQSIDYNSSFDTDTIFELGNPGFVEEAVNSVETPITMTSNEWGNTDLEAMMFEKFKVKPIISATATRFTAAGAIMGQTATIASAGDWLQIVGNGATIIGDYVKVKAITAAAPNYIYSIEGTYPMSAVPSPGYYACLCNKYVITENDLDAKYTDLILPYRYSPTSTNLMYSVLLPRAVVNNLTYRMDTGGAAEITYALTGDEERLVLGSMRELIEAPASLISYATSGTLTVAIPTYNEGRRNAGGKYLLYANNQLATTNQIVNTLISTLGTLHVKLDSGLGLDSTGRYKYFFSRITKKGFRGVQTFTSGIGKLKRGYMDVCLATGNASTTKILRISGVDMTIPLARESLTEMGTDKPYGRQLTNPFKAEVTVSFTRNDLREYALLVNKVSQFDAGTLKEILMDDLKASKNTKIEVKLYNSRITHSANTLLKTFKFTSCNFIGDTTTTPVTGGAGLVFNFSSPNVTITGSGLPPIYL